MLAVGLTVAIGIPAVWWATRPAGSAGVAVVGAADPDPATAATSPDSTPSASLLGAVRTRRAEPARSPAAGPVPVRLRIPAARVDARVDPAGVSTDGQMAIPEQASVVGWYRYGPAPGSPSGTAVLAGHVDSAAQGPGALFRLRSAPIGSVVAVRLQGGEQVRYRITGRESIVKRRLPVERIFLRTGSPRLVIITCGGPFDRERARYRDNVLIVAEPAAATGRDTGGSGNAR